MLTWSSTGATRVLRHGGVDGSIATSGTQTVTPVSAGIYDYAVTCSGAGGSASSTATLTVNVPTPTVAIARVADIHFDGPHCDAHLGSLQR